MIEVVDAHAAGKALHARTLACPSCKTGRLHPWGYARARTVTAAAGTRLTVRPERGRCATCATTHVLLPADLLAGRAYTIGIIGPALAGFARGQGRRSIAAALGVPASTIADWTRRLAANAEAIRLDALRRVVAIDQELLSKAERLRPSAAALDTLGRLATAIAARFHPDGIDPWRLLAAMTGGRLLRPTYPG